MEDDALRVVQLSDFHLFGNPEKTLLGVNTQESLQAVLDLIAMNDHPYLLITSGDLSQDGSEDSYSRLSDMLNTFKIPVYFVPGNHDYSKSIAVLARDYVSQQKHVLVKQWQFILLDSQMPKMVEGCLDLLQLDFLESCLQKNPDHHAIIIFHHAPIAVGSAWIDRLGLQNAETFWEILKRYSCVKAVLFGHVHQQHEGVKHGIKYFSVPSTCFQFKKNSHDFALENLPPGYRWLNLYPSGVIETGINRIKKYIGKFEENSLGY